MRRLILAALIAAAFAAGVRWGTFVAGGSDSYCYMHQAERWASGRLQVPEPLALEAPWPDAPLTFAPAGHLPSRTVPGAVVPLCPPGLSMAMAPVLAVAGTTAAFLVVPMFGAILIAATYAAGSRYGPRVGLASALVVVSSPVFLYQVVQPMSDVPAAALWITAVAAATSTRRHGPAAAGLAAAAAILVRPNLAPLGAPLVLFLVLRPERPWKSRVRAAAAFAGCAALGVAAVLLVQSAFYGTPWRTGYGPPSTLFNASNIAPNAVRYSTWITQAQTPAWLLALTAPFLLPGALTALFAGIVLVNVASYLPYVVFDDWSFVRFLLPSVPPLVILMFASLDAICRRLSPWTARPAIAAAAVILAVIGIRQAEAQSAFRLQALESRYARAGTFVAGRLPPNAVVITSWQSGSVRFYSGRRTLVWDVLDPLWLDRAMAYLRERGLEPFLLFETWEEAGFRRRFAASPVAALDWPPIAEIGQQVRIYRPEDREAYKRGTIIRTEFAR